MLTSSMGFAVDMHYCGGKMKSYNFFGDAKSCYATGDMVCYADKADDAHEHQQCNLQRKKCCENRMFVVQPVENQNIPLFNSSTDDDQELHTVLYSYELDPDAKYFENTFIERDYRPPLLLRTTPVLLQSFLI